MKVNGISVNASFPEDGATCYELACGVVAAASLDGAELALEADDGTTSTAAARSVTCVERVDSQTTRVWLKDSTVATKDEEIAALNDKVSSLTTSLSEKESALSEREVTISELSERVTSLDNVVSTLRERLSALGITDVIGKGSTDGDS